MRAITFALFLIATLFSWGVSAQFGDTGSGFGTEQPQFLAEEDAYQITGTIEQGTLTLTWQQADTYYLYKDKYKLRINGTDVTAQTLFDEGKTIYDPFFEQEKTVYYDSNTIKIVMGERQGVVLAELDYQGCTDKGLCYPPSTRYLSIDFDNNQVSETSQPSSGSNTLNQGNASYSDISWPVAIIFALIGGLILNLMPCVFPVLSLKAVSLASGGDHRAQGLAYTAGAIVFFLLLAIILISLRAAGQSVGWGFQLQQPLFIGALVLVFTLITLWMAGTISFGARLQGVGQSLTEQQGTKGSFATGALAAVVASPCTAPFMATALTYAITQPAPIALAVFAALGLGMALPILLISYIPALSNLLPRPGNWMITFRQSLSFLMALTVVWLIWVFTNQTNSLSAALLMCLVVTLCFGIFLTSKGVKKTGYIVCVACFGALALLTTSDSGQHSPKTAFNPEQIEGPLQNGQGVLLNVTADWCITCIANERAVLSGEQFEQLLDEEDIVYVKADWTTPSPEVDALLAQFNRVGVPLYVYFPSKDERPVVLPQVLSISKIENAIFNADN